jgi:hypothetical protein
MRNKTRINYSFMVTQEERPDLLDLAGDEPVTLYIRRLIREDARKQGKRWLDNLPAPAIKRTKSGKGLYRPRRAKLRPLGQECPAQPEAKSPLQQAGLRRG